MGTNQLRRRLDRMESHRHATPTDHDCDLSKLNETEIAFLESMFIDGKLRDDSGAFDLSSLTDEELDELERIYAKVAA